MPTESIRGIEIYYEIRGSGPRLLYIGGSGGDLRQKPSVFDGPLARNFEVLSYDQRGLGRTDAPDTRYTMADYAEDAAALLDAVGWDRCAAMGVSFGGMVAQELAIRHPARIDRLVLACTSSGGVGKPSYPLHELQHLSPADRALKSIELSDTRCNVAWREANPDVTRGMIEFINEQSKTADGEPGREVGARRQLEARADHDTWNRLPSLSMPVYICGGRHDGIAPPSNQEALARAIPNSRMELFEGGHMFLMQDRSAFEKIVQFIAQPRAE